MGERTYLWSTSGAEEKSYLLWLDNAYVYPRGTSNRYIGRSLRCLAIE